MSLGNSLGDTIPINIHFHGTLSKWIPTRLRLIFHEPKEFTETTICMVLQANKPIWVGAGTSRWNLSLLNCSHPFVRSTLNRTTMLGYKCWQGRAFNGAVPILYSRILYAKRINYLQTNQPPTHHTTIRSANIYIFNGVLLINITITFAPPQINPQAPTVSLKCPQTEPIIG